MSDDDSENDEEDLSQLSQLSFEPSREIDSDDDAPGCCHWSRGDPGNDSIAIEPFSIELMGKNSREFADTTTPGKCYSLKCLLFCYFLINILFI